MIGNSPEYDAFVAKFKARHTSDDTFTPENIYNCVRDWAVRKYRLQGAEIVRPFWPGEDVTKADYPEGSVVIDNPPCSILSKIVRFYNDRGVRYFLFCNGLTAINLVRDRRAGVVAAGVSIRYDNGASVATNFVTNLSGDVLIEAAPDLHDALERVNDANLKAHRRRVRRLAHPYGTVTSAGLNYLAVHHVPFKVARRDALFVHRLDCGVSLFGGAFLLSPRAEAERAAAEREAAERAAAERAAAEREAAERAAAERIMLSERELELQRGIGRD